MNTRLLMRASALFLGLLGVAASFAPHEVLALAGGNPGRVSALLVQIAGALYLGFAALNWTAQANLIGGIYSRPVALANFGHFAVAAIALVKGVVDGETQMAVLLGCIAYVLFGVLFGLVVFLPPRGLGKPAGG
jgi:hypothetical protein